MVIKELNIADFPSINVIANAYRDNLLFEMDAIAVKTIDTEKQK